jgi:threonyl-tRNA synthetase
VAVLIPISNQSEKQMEYLASLTKELKAIGIDLEIYDGHDTFNKRIKNAEDMKIPLILIIGDEEADSKTINVRNKIEQRRYQISEKELLAYITKQMKKNI